jgi:hypothetical protein
MPSLPAVGSDRRTVSNDTPAPADLSLAETLRVLEVARGLQRERAVAEQALARNELRDMLRRRLLDAAAVTGDSVTAQDVETAIDQYFARQHVYTDPPLSFPVVLAHLYVLRFPLLIAAVVIVLCRFVIRQFLSG